MTINEQSHRELAEEHMQVAYDHAISSDERDQARAREEVQWAIPQALLALDDTLRTLLCWEEPPAEVLERVKAETVEKATQEGQYGPEGDETTVLTPMMWDAAVRRRNRPRSDAQPSEAPGDPRPATDAPGPAQTLETDEVTDLLAALQASIDRAKAKRVEREAGDRG